MSHLLFQDELDEESPEGDHAACPLQDEPDEESPLHSETDEPEDGVSHLFQVELDEPEDKHPTKVPTLAPKALQCLQDEPDEVSDSDESAYLGDTEISDAPQKSIVALSFSTVSQFLATQLCKPSAAAEKTEGPSRKKRCYDNSKRQAKAAARREERDHGVEKQHRVARNDQAT